jgi:hypothetical protein
MALDYVPLVCFKKGNLKATDSHLTGFYSQITRVIFVLFFFFFFTPTPLLNATSGTNFAQYIYRTSIYEHLLFMSWIIQIVERIRKVTNKVQFLLPFTPLFTEHSLNVYQVPGTMVAQL